MGGLQPNSMDGLRRQIVQLEKQLEAEYQRGFKAGVKRICDELDGAIDKLEEDKIDSKVI